MALSSRVRRWGLLLCVVVGTLASLEWYLRWNYLRIARSDRITPGLTRPDPQLGWRLNARWQGVHEHHDFQAAYTINGSGFRGADPRMHSGSASLVAVVGDSFTFGTGVDDSEVFTALLDSRSPASNRVYNFATPGFSTDQELLLIERDVLRFEPDVILLVVYLANDLFDNQLPAALQVRRSKPRFVLDHGKLVLVNSPVRLDVPPERPPSLLTMVLGDSSGGMVSLRQRWEARSRLFGLVSEALFRPMHESAAFEERHAPALELFWALFDRIQRSSEAGGARLVLALLGGRSYVETPTSLSGAFQEFFRVRLAEEALRRQVPLIDLAFAMRERFQSSGGDWFFPNEGHLNAKGHQTVAEIAAGPLEALSLPETQ